MASELTFQEVSDANLSRVKRWHPGFPTDNQWTIADWSNAMCGEAGELANVVKKIRRYECGFKGELDPPLDELKVALGKEVADVFLYLNLLAMQQGIDMQRSIVDKFNEVSLRQGFPERLEYR